MPVSLVYLINVSAANNLRDNSIASSTVVAIYIVVKQAATFATSRACKKEISLREEIKSISTIILSQFSTWVCSDTLRVKLVNLSHLHYSTNLSITFSSNMASSNLTQLKV